MYISVYCGGFPGNGAAVLATHVLVKRPASRTLRAASAEAAEWARGEMEHRFDDQLHISEQLTP